MRVFEKLVKGIFCVTVHYTHSVQRSVSIMSLPFAARLDPRLAFRVPIMDSSLRGEPEASLKTALRLH
jgi:hypothetical protein